MEEKICVGARLRELRNQKELSQKELSNFVDIKQPLLARYEKCAINPSYENLIRLADYFEVSTDYLLGRTNNPQCGIYEQSQLSSENIDELIEMCFDPTTEANAKLKEVLKKMLEEQK